MQLKFICITHYLPLLATSRAVYQYFFQANIPSYSSNTRPHRSPASVHCPRPRQLGAWTPSSRSAANGKKRPTWLALVWANFLQKLKRKTPLNRTNRSQSGYYPNQCSGTSHNESEPEEPEMDGLSFTSTYRRIVGSGNSIPSIS
jgi:hypothetical protein